MNQNKRLMGNLAILGVAGALVFSAGAVVSQRNLTELRREKLEFSRRVLVDRAVDSALVVEFGRKLGQFSPGVSERSEVHEGFFSKVTYRVQWKGNPGELRKAKRDEMWLAYRYHLVDDGAPFVRPTYAPVPDLVRMADLGERDKERFTELFRGEIRKNGAR